MTTLRIMFVIRSLRVGGAERQASLLARGLSARGHSVLLHRRRRLDSPALIDDLERSNVELAAGTASLVTNFRRFRPDVIYGFGPGENVIALALAKSRVGCRAVLGIRSSDQDTAHFNRLGKAMYRLEACLGVRADLIIANSSAGRDVAVDRGVPSDRIQVIWNGIETDRFSPAEAERSAVRTSWGVDAETRVVGVVARLHPKKDHTTLFRAISRTATGAARYAIIGSGAEDHTRLLHTLATDLGIGSRLIWVGEVQDMSTTYNSLDLLCLPSSGGEGFPNVIGEAMACGVPCVATDVGDVASVVSGLGFVVPPASPDGLAEALDAALARLDRDREWPQRVRERALSAFSVSSLIDSTEQALLRITTRDESRAVGD